MGGRGVGEGEVEEKGDDQDIHAGDGVPGVTDRNDTSHCVMYSVIVMLGR